MKWFFLFYLIAMAFAVAMFMSGCACMGDGGQSSHPTNAPPLSNVAKGLDHMILLSTLVLGLSVGLFFLLPAAHRLSLSIAVAAGGVWVTSLFLRVALPWLSWVCLIFGVCAVGVLGYELVTKRRVIEAKLGLEEPPNASPPANPK